MDIKGEGQIPKHMKNTPPKCYAKIPCNSTYRKTQIWKIECVVGFKISLA